MELDVEMYWCLATFANNRFTSTAPIAWISCCASACIACLPKVRTISMRVMVLDKVNRAFRYHYLFPFWADLRNPISRRTEEVDLGAHRNRSGSKDQGPLEGRE